MFNIVIMAGGQGQRFWPKSIKSMPKQFHKIVSDKTMIQETFNRVYPEIKLDNIFVVAGEKLMAVAAEQLPLLKKQNLITEPVGKNTAPAIGLAAAYIYKKDPDAVIAVLTADHVVESREQFLKALNTAVRVAEEGHIVTFGITPDRPATEYGYIEIGEKIGQSYELDVFSVKMFREKPTIEVAREFVRRDVFLWNSGLFAFKVRVILDAMKEHMAPLYSALMKIYDSIGTEDEKTVKMTEFEKIESESIDYGVMEKAADIACVKPDFLWDDVGSWGAVSRHVSGDKEGNIVQGNVVSVDSKNNIVLGEENSIISVIGIQDLIVVKDKDKVLVCHRSRDQHIKEALSSMAGKKKYMQYL
ncbi:MAG TPA: mannose-1-phosphate guanylyltransferase [Spirochaetes bacterium]|nr:mannose-1-phosphate guanylyltransferase [Spirochaetota bacterium]